jgi:16S rRNA processing protein RimM
VARHHREPESRPLRAAIAAADVRWVALGYVMGTHGLRGGLRVKQHNQDSDLLFSLPEIVLRLQGQLQVHEVADVRAGGKGLLLQLGDVRTIEQAELLRGAELCVPRELLPPLDDGEFYYTDLEGLAVVTPSGESVGVADGVREYPAAHVLRVRAESGVWEVPMREPYLVAVEVSDGRVVVDHLEDLELEKLT